MRSKSFARLIPALAILVLAAYAAQAQERWKTLPATPKLPQQSSGGFVDRKDALIWYATYGDERKPAVLLLHGGAGSSDYWGHLTRDLIADYRVIVFDCRGQGRSTNDADAISYKQMASDAIAVMNQLAIESFSVVGWSDGANIGMALALAHPSRVTTLVAFAGNASPAGYQPTSNPKIMAQYLARSAKEYEDLSPHPKRRAEIMRMLAAMWKTEPKLQTADLRRISAATTIVLAEHDEIIRTAHSEELARAIPSARLVRLKEVSHFALLQDPASFTAAVRVALRFKR